MRGALPAGRRGSFVLDFFFVSFFCVKGKRKKTNKTKEINALNRIKATKVYCYLKRFVA
jgi:hypothetical protein